MIRRSGSRPAVKRWKLASVMLRRAASGHIPATQFGKFAAASRIADAVIKGCPEAPSSPLQGGGAPSGPGAACVGFADFGPENRLPRKFETPLPGDWASASPSAPPKNSSTAATKVAPVRLANTAFVEFMSFPSGVKTAIQKALSRFPIA